MQGHERGTFFESRDLCGQVEEETPGGARRHGGQQLAGSRVESTGGIDRRPYRGRGCLTWACRTERRDGFADQGRHVVGQVPRQAGDGVANIFLDQSRGNGHSDGQLAQAREQAEALGLVPRHLLGAGLEAEQLEALLIAEEREQQRLVKPEEAEVGAPRAGQD